MDYPSAVRLMIQRSGDRLLPISYFLEARAVEAWQPGSLGVTRDGFLTYEPTDTRLLGGLTDELVPIIPVPGSIILPPSPTTARSARWRGEDVPAVLRREWSLDELPRSMIGRENFRFIGEVHKLWRDQVAPLLSDIEQAAALHLTIYGLAPLPVAPEDIGAGLRGVSVRPIRERGIESEWRQIAIVTREIQEAWRQGALDRAAAQAREARQRVAFWDAMHAGVSTIADAGAGAVSLLDRITSPLGLAAVGLVAVAMIAR